MRRVIELDDEDSSRSRWLQKVLTNVNEAELQQKLNFACFFFSFDISHVHHIQISWFRAAAVATLAICCWTWIYIFSVIRYHFCEASLAVSLFSRHFVRLLRIDTISRGWDDNRRRRHGRRIPCCLIKAKTNHNVDMTLHTLLLFALRLILIESDTSKNRLKRDDGRYRMVCSFSHINFFSESRDSIESFVLFMVEEQHKNRAEAWRRRWRTLCVAQHIYRLLCFVAHHFYWTISLLVFHESPPTTAQMKHKDFFIFQIFFPSTLIKPTITSSFWYSNILLEPEPASSWFDLID